MPSRHLHRRLRDGQRVELRSVYGHDEPALLRFMQSLSPESQRLRFFSGACDLSEAARWAAGADGIDHIGIVAADLAGQIIGHAAACRVYGSRSEVAVEIDETHRHLGLATILIAELACRAEGLGISTFIAEVLPENPDMLAVFHNGFHARETSVVGEVDVEFPTSAWRDLASHLAS